MRKLLALAIAPLLVVAAREARAGAIVTEVYQGSSSSSPAYDQVEVFCYGKTTADPACDGYRVCDGTWAAIVGATYVSGVSPGTRSCSALQSSLGVGQRRVSSRGTSITSGENVWLEDSSGKVIDAPGSAACANTVGMTTERRDNPSAALDACHAYAGSLGQGMICSQPHVTTSTGACVDPEPIATWSGNGETCKVFSSDPECAEEGCRGDGGQVWALMQAFSNPGHTSIKCGLYELEFLDDDVLMKAMTDAAARVAASGGTFQIATDVVTATGGCDAAGAGCAAGFECSEGTCVTTQLARLERAAGGTVTPTSTTLNRPGGRVQFVNATGLMHDKYCIFDGTSGPTVTIGSSNFKDTITRNLDLRVFVTGSATLAGKLGQEHDDLFGHCGGTWDASSKTWSVSCTTTYNTLRDHTNLTLCGGAADLFVGPWSEANSAQSLNVKIRGRIERKEALLADPTLKCGGYIGKCSNDLARSCDPENKSLWASQCGSASAGCLNACSPTPFHYHAAAGNAACANADCSCTTNADCSQGYLCDATPGHAAKCAKDTCVCDACFDDGLLETATRYRGSHFALTDNCMRRGLKRIYDGAGGRTPGTVEILQDQLFWHNIYSASRLLCEQVNPTDVANRLVVKVENWEGKNHEKSFCLETPNGPVCHIGSANISTNSNKNNTEDSLLFYGNATLATAFTHHLDKMMYGLKPDGSLYTYGRMRDVPECTTTTSDKSLENDVSQ